MTIDEAIQHAEDVVHKKEQLLKIHNDTQGLWPGYSLTPSEERECIKCAEDHKQLSAWLKELKMLRGSKMINAVEAKSRVGNLDKAMQYIENTILYAIDDNRCYCFVAIKDLKKLGVDESNVTKLMGKLKKLGYDLEYCNSTVGADIKIDWSEPQEEEDNAVWVEQKRYNGESFYTCSKCGGAAVEEKIRSCPNCKSKMQ